MIKLEYWLTLCTPWREAERAQYVNGCEALKHEAAEANAHDTVRLSIGEIQGDSMLRATIWRQQPTMVWSGWRYSYEPGADPGGPHVYRRGFEPGSESPADVLASCRQMLLAQITET